MLKLILISILAIITSNAQKYALGSNQQRRQLQFDQNSTQFLISTDLSLNCSSADSYILISDVDGYMVAYKCYTRDKKFGIFAYIFDENGETTSDLITVKEFDEFDSQPAVAGLFNGNFVVAWRDATQLKAKWYDSTGEHIRTIVVDHDENLEDNTINIYNNDYENSTIIVYQKKENGKENIYGIIYDGEGQIIGPKAKINDNTGNDATNPSICSTMKNLELVVVWEQQGDIYCRRYNKNMVAIGKKFKVNDYTDNKQYNPDIDSFPGGFAVTWISEQDSENSYRQISVKQFNENGGVVMEETMVNTFTEIWDGDSNSPQIVGSWLSGYIGYIIAWTSIGQDADASLGIYAQVFDLQGAFQSEEFVVNEKFLMNQSHPTIASFALNGNMYFSFDSGVVNSLDTRIYGIGYQFCQEGWEFNFTEDDVGYECTFIPLPAVRQKRKDGLILIYGQILSLVMLLLY